MIHTVVNEIMTVMMRIHWNMSEYFIVCAFVGLNNKLYTMHSTYIKSVKFVLCVCVCVCVFVCSCELVQQVSWSCPHNYNYKAM